MPRARGETLHETLEQQCGRVMEEIERHRREFRQIAMDFGDDQDARRQLEANMRHWERRLAQFDADIEQEPDAFGASTAFSGRASSRWGWCACWPETN